MAFSITCIAFPFISGAILHHLGVGLGWKIVAAIVATWAICTLAFVYRYMRVDDARVAGDSEKALAS